MPRVTGIGGCFFRVADPEKTRDWYQQHLGFNTDEFGTNFEWRQSSEPEKKGFSQWSPFKAATDYFDGSFMMNYRVDDLEALVTELKEKGVEIIDEIQSEDYGKFVHIRDGDGQMVELWEPVDDVYDEMVGDGRTS